MRPATVNRRWVKLVVHVPDLDIPHSVDEDGQLVVTVLRIVQRLKAVRLDDRLDEGLPAARPWYWSLCEQ